MDQGKCDRWNHKILEKFTHNLWNYRSQHWDKGQCKHGGYRILWDEKIVFEITSLMKEYNDLFMQNFTKLKGV